MNNKPPEGFRLLGVGEKVPMPHQRRLVYDSKVSPWMDGGYADEGHIVTVDDIVEFAVPLHSEQPAVLPWSAAERKRIPVTTGFLDYFPAAIAEVAKLSLAGNDQHNPGTPLHWDKSKSTDEADALLRHLMERGTFDTDGQRHSAKVAWRAMALLQRELEGEK